MFRPTSGLALAGLIVFGVIIANLTIHPAGTKAAGAALVNVQKPGLNALLGKTS